MFVTLIIGILNIRTGEIIYANGVNEAMNAEKVQFSNEKLLSQIEGNRDNPASDIIDNMLQSIRMHSQGTPQSDDIAMLVLKYYGKQ